jgi:catechol 2,3-dioxygenase-like lactoylglutathione lyase family enzyme
MRIDRVDHLLLTVVDLDRTCRFYQETLGFEMVTFAGNRARSGIWSAKDQSSPDGRGI